jgi:hypothetical protein
VQVRKPPVRLSCTTHSRGPGLRVSLAAPKGWLYMPCFALMRACLHGAHSICKQPTSMNSTSHFVGWAPEPRGRGTLGLLWSCFATLFLCTWSAIHPNLPGLNDSQAAILWRKIRYVVLCLIAPELVAWSAIQHLWWARNVKRQVSNTMNRTKYTSERLTVSRFLSGR